MQKLYRYHAYGLIISSEIPFPELLPADLPHTDVTINVRAVPRHLSAKENPVNGNIKMNHHEYLHFIPKVANIYVNNGSGILVEPHPAIDEKSIRILILGISIAAILYQRNQIPLHASAINYQGHLVAFCGPSGAGKTTLVTALKQKGHCVFSDDVCVLEKTGKKEIIAWPSYPMLKTCEDTFTKLGLGPAEEQYRLRAGFHKYARFFHDDFDLKPRKIRQIFLLNCDAGCHELAIRKLTPAESFKALLTNAYKPNMVAGMKKEGTLFGVASQLAAEALVYQINRPPAGNFIADLVSLVESELPHQTHDNHERYFWGH